MYLFVLKIPNSPATKKPCPTKSILIKAIIYKVLNMHQIHFCVLSMYYVYLILTINLYSKYCYSCEEQRHSEAKYLVRVSPYIFWTIKNSETVYVMIKDSTASGAWLPGCKSSLYRLLADWPEAGYITSLCLSLPIYKISIIIEPDS